MLFWFFDGVIFPYHGEGAQNISSNASGLWYRPMGSCGATVALRENPHVKRRIVGYMIPKTVFLQMGDATVVLE